MLDSRSTNSAHGDQCETCSVEEFVDRLVAKMGWQKWEWSVETLRSIHRIEAESVAHRISRHKVESYLSLRRDHNDGEGLSTPHALEKLGISQ